MSGTAQENASGVLFLSNLQRLMRVKIKISRGDDRSACMQNAMGCTLHKVQSVTVKQRPRRAQCRPGKWGKHPGQRGSNNSSSR